MAFDGRDPGRDLREFTKKFEKDLKQFDTNRDNKISEKEELRRTIKASGSWWFCSHKNLNGSIDDAEKDNLIDFAQKYPGVRITTHAV